MRHFEPSPVPSSMRRNGGRIRGVAGAGRGPVAETG